METLKELLELAHNEKRRCYELALEALHNDNDLGNKVHTARASAFQKMEYAIRDKIKELEEFNDNFTGGQIKMVEVKTNKSK